MWKRRGWWIDPDRDGHPDPNPDADRDSDHTSPDV
jgi:hypothetical protein